MVPVIDAIVIEISKNAVPQTIAGSDGLIDKMVDRIVVFFEIKKQRAKVANAALSGMEA